MVAQHRVDPVGQTPAHGVVKYWHEDPQVKKVLFCQLGLKWDFCNKFLVTD